MQFYCESLTEYNKLGNKAHTVLGENKFKFTTANVHETGYILKSTYDNLTYSFFRLKKDYSIQLYTFYILSRWIHHHNVSERLIS